MTWVRAALSFGLSLPLALLVSACRAGGGAPHATELDVQEGFVRDAHLAPDARTALLIEEPLYLRGDDAGPRRALVLVEADGTRSTVLASTLERPLLDVAFHPSGEHSALLVSDAGYTLVRLDARGAVLGELTIADERIDSDPPVRVGEPPASPVSPYSRDTGRVAALGEDVVVATRTGRNSVVAYRYAFEADAFDERYRTLVVPAYSVLPIGLTGGSYDTFGLVANPHAVYLDVDPAGVAYVGTVFAFLSSPSFVRAHASVFGETLVGDPDYADSYVTRLDPEGARLGTSVITTELEDEIYGLRAVDGGAYVLGRNELWNEQGTGHDALVARVDSVTGAVDLRAFDVDRGDIAFDAAVGPAGELIVVGASGYTQNPSGASISGVSAAFVRVFDATGGERDLTLQDSPRHDSVRVASWLAEGALLVGGMRDGPGTHTADADLGLLYARGFLTALPAGL